MSQRRRRKNEESGGGRARVRSQEQEEEDPTEERKEEDNGKVQYIKVGSIELRKGPIEEIVIEDSKRKWKHIKNSEKEKGDELTNTVVVIPEIEEGICPVKLLLPKLLQ